MNRIPDDVRNAIRRDLLAGSSIRGTAESFGVSLSTVQRIKKEMPDAVTQSDNSSSSDYSNTYYTKSEAEFVKKLDAEAALFEDPEEGWVYHVSQSDHIIKTSGKWWNGIVYPESASENWVNQLKNIGCEIAISPLHDRDVWSHDSPEMVDRETGEIFEQGAKYKAGDPKKAHWHIILKFERSISARDVNQMVRRITNGPYLQKCITLKGSYEYFLHLNNPEKFQFYDKNDIQRLNGFHIEMNKYEQGELMTEILNRAVEEEWTSMRDFMKDYGRSPEAVMLISGKSGVLTRIIRENYSKKHEKDPNNSLSNGQFGASMALLIDAVKKSAKNNQGGNKNGKS